MQPVCNFFLRFTKILIQERKTMQRINKKSPDRFCVSIGGFDDFYLLNKIFLSAFDIESAEYAVLVQHDTVRAVVFRN